MLTPKFCSKVNDNFMASLSTQILSYLNLKDRMFTLISSVGVAYNLIGLQNCIRTKGYCNSTGNYLVKLL